MSGYFYSFRWPAPEKEQVLCSPSFHGCPIEDERLLSALENLSDADLELITLYAYEEYDTVEISKVFGTTKQNISKKIRRITNFIKNFQIEVV